MNELKKYDGQLVERIPAMSGNVPPGPEVEAPVDYVGVISRRWRIALFTFVAMCVIGIPSIWLLMSPLYSVAGAIRVAPILPDILTGDPDKSISNYQQFMNTQVELMTSSQVIQRVADDVSGRNLAFCQDAAMGLAARLDRMFNKTRTKPDAASVLKQAVFDNVIGVQAVGKTELIKITMRCKNADDAKQIVNAFIRAYMASEISAGSKEQDQQLRVLEDEQKLQADKLQRQREQIRQLAQEYGTTTLGDRQNMMLSRVTGILGELTKVETRRANLEDQVQVFEQSKDQVLSPQESLRVRNEYINSDPTVVQLTQQIARVDLELVRHKQLYVADNPALVQEQELLTSLKARLEEKRQELSTGFDKAMSEETNRVGVERLNNAKIELAQAIAYEKRLREKLAKEDTETIEIGRKQLGIQDVQEQMILTKAMYDKVRQRIQELEMERKRPARVTIAYDADIEPIADKRLKGTGALIAGAMACGLLLAFLRDKADHSLHTPAEVAKRIGVRVIGTTTGMNAVARAALPEMMIRDYDTLRANLGLLDGEGVPRTLVVTSPGMSDGKTTVAINLATSMAQSGKKVLLVDGDLRKPDIAKLLGLPSDSRGLQELALGKDGDSLVCTVASSGLHVLASDASNESDAYELLTLLFTSKRLEVFVQKYDHVIIDTPPLLAFPDALMLAKMADAVILASLASQTTAPDMNEAKEKLALVGARVLGIVLGNVSVDHSYYRYGYGYYSQEGDRRMKKKHVHRKSLLLLPPQDEHGSARKPDSR